MNIQIVQAGVGKGPPLPYSSFCKKIFNKDDESIATCTDKEYVTLCRECYNKAANSVR